MYKILNFVRILIFLMSFISVEGLADPARLLSSKEVETLSQSDQWKKLLFYAKKAFNRQASLFDSQEFFVSTEGKTSPLLEMQAMITGMYNDPSAFPNPENHPLCRFPVRAEFLISKLKIDRTTLPTPKCELREKWLARNLVKKVSLVFSSYYTDNPASMFGHSFLKLRINPVDLSGKQQHSANELLDFAVNYAAHMDDIDVFNYYWKGLSGQFPGKFAMEPFYVKVQEYNNYEQRDLWVYDLALNEEESVRLASIMREIGENKINYFYFDDNCSALMLALLDAAKPELNLYSKLPHQWIIPVDTLKTVTSEPGLVTDIQYIPSTRTKFLTRFRKLSSDEQTLVDYLVKKNAPKDLANDVASLSLKSKVGVLDTLVELVDFKEDIAGADLGKVFKDLRAEALKIRASIPERSEKLIITPNENERPDKAHGTTLLSLAGGAGSEGGRLAQLHWRPALHGFADAGEGYPQGLNIGFLNTRISWDNEAKKYILRNLGGIEIKSVPTVEQVIKKNAWMINVGQRHRFDCGPKTDMMCLSSFLNFGYGVSNYLFTEYLTGYALATGQLSILHDGYRSFSGEPGLLSGISLTPPGPFRMNVEISRQKSYGIKKVTYLTKGDLTAMYALSNSKTLILNGDYETNYGSSFVAGYGIYF